MKILLCGDFSATPSGFGKYQKQLAYGLTEAGHEVAEMAHSSYANQKSLVKWKMYPTSVLPNEPGFEEFASNRSNVHGLWRWEKTCLHFRPDIVISPLDPWCFFFQAFSSLKPYYHLILSPTVDSAPQKPEYINIFNFADTLVTYTEYGKMVLEAEGLNVKRAIPVGIDIDIFKPVKNKAIHRTLHGLQPDITIIGFVARNNPRKRIPELLEAFSLLLDWTKREDLYLYLHTTFPETSWDIPTLLIKYGVAHRVLFTYKCTESGKPFSSTYHDINCASPYTNRLTGKMLHLRNAISEKELAGIYNLFDLYVQCSSNEGFGIPLIEAAACNIPVMGVAHSATNELLQDLGGAKYYGPEPIDHGTQAGRMVVEPVILARMINNRLENMYEVNYRPIIESKYSEKQCVDAWLGIIDEISRTYVSKWDAPPIEHNEIKVPDNCSHSELVSICMQELPCRWDYNALQKIEYLNNHQKIMERVHKIYTRREFLDEANHKINDMTHYNNIRWGLEPLKFEPWMA